MCPYCIHTVCERKEEHPPLAPSSTERVVIAVDPHKASIEGASGLGAPLTRRLAADGVEVIDVPAKLAARVRLLSTESMAARPMKLVPSRSGSRH